MKSASTWTAGVLVAIASLSCAALGAEPTAAASKPAKPAAAASSAPADLPTAQHEKVMEVSATVTSIDPTTRMLGLKADDGTTGAYQAGPEVRNFSQIHVGDKVVVSYYRGIAAAVQPKGTPLSKKVNTLDVATAAEPGAKPGVGVGTATHATVVIKKVDTKANTVTFLRPDGITRTLPVESQEGKDFIRKIKKGDQVEIVYVEAVAIEVRPK